MQPHGLFVASFSQVTCGIFIRFAALNSFFSCADPIAVKTHLDEKMMRVSLLVSGRRADRKEVRKLFFVMPTRDVAFVIHLQPLFTSRLSALSSLL